MLAAAIRCRHGASSRAVEHITNDVNRAWTPALAVEVMNAASAHGWFEQPCKTLDQCAQVRPLTNQPIMLDECLLSFRHHITAWRGWASLRMRRGSASPGRRGGGRKPGHDRNGTVGPRIVELGQGCGLAGAGVRDAGRTPKRSPRAGTGPTRRHLFDYIRRAMPFHTPKSLSNDEAYAVTAYILHRNELIGRGRGRERGQSGRCRHAESGELRRHVGEVGQRVKLPAAPIGRQLADRARNDFTGSARREPVKLAGCGRPRVKCEFSWPWRRDRGPACGQGTCRIGQGFSRTGTAVPLAPCGCAWCARARLSPERPLH